MYVYSCTFGIWYIVLYTVPLLETAVSMCRPRCDVWIIFVLLSGHNKYSAAVRDLFEKHKRCTKLHIETYEDIQKTSKTFKNDLAKLEAYCCWSESCNLLSIIQFLWEKNVLTVHVESSKQLSILSQWTHPYRMDCSYTMLHPPMTDDLSTKPLGYSSSTWRTLCRNNSKHVETIRNPL